MDKLLECLHYLYDNFKFPVFLLDPETDLLVYANIQAEKTYGYPFNTDAFTIRDLTGGVREKTENDTADMLREEQNLFLSIHKNRQGELFNVRILTYPVLCRQQQKKYLLLQIFPEEKTMETETILNIQSSYFRQLFEESPDGMAIMVLRGKQEMILETNRAFEKMFGFRENEIRGKNINDLFHKEKDCTAPEEITKRILAGETIKEKIYRRNKAGRMLCIDFIGYPIRINKEITGTYGVYRDVTEIKQKERYLRLYEKALENMSSGVAITTRQGEIMDINNAFCTIIGKNREEIIGQNIMETVNTDLDYEKVLATIRQKGTWHNEVEIRNQHNKFRILDVKITYLSDEQQKDWLVAIAEDVTKVKLKEREIRFLAFRDSLTGAYNRSFFMESIETKIHNSEMRENEWALFFLDLDNFKEINDTMGHKTGDDVLKITYKRIAHIMREQDITARIGGDEFLVLVDSFQDIEMLKTIVKRILKSFENDFSVSGNSIRVDISIGIAVYPRDGVTSDELINNADTAMYEAKKLPGSAYKFYIPFELQ